MGLLIMKETWVTWKTHKRVKKGGGSFVALGVAARIIREKKKMSLVMAEEDRKSSERSSRINIKIVSNDGDTVTVRVKRSVKMKDLMMAYNERRSVAHNTFEFLLDGHRIQGEQTPDELEMKDGDEIDAMVHGHGGSAIWSL